MSKLLMIFSFFFFFFLENRQPIFHIHFHAIEKSSMIILLLLKKKKYLFCHTNESLKGLQQQEGNFLCFLKHTYGSF